MNPKKEAFKTTARTIISGLEKRNMEGYYFETAEEAVKAVLETVPEGSVVSWGGSETIKETGLLDALRAGNYTCLDRYTAKSPAETREIFLKSFAANYYFMSTNAITLSGELVNIDGVANRVACLCYGPDNVIIFAGMNKVAADVESAVKRIRTNA